MRITLIIDDELSTQAKALANRALLDAADASGCRQRRPSDCDFTHGGRGLSAPGDAPTVFVDPTLIEIAQAFLHAIFATPGVELLSL